MGFYEQISKYYDYIFPTGQQQVEFIKNSVGLPPKKILDVACGSGGYSVELAKQGYEVTAVDLDAKMVEMARDKALREKVQINVLQSDMKELDKVGRQAGLSSVSEGKFDLVFCIGNSLVHLGSIKHITESLKQMNTLLVQAGVLVLQIINYDRIIAKGVNELPFIKNEAVGLEFIRKYEYDETRGKIHFNTILNIDDGIHKEKYENSIELLPLLSEDMKKALLEAGFAKNEVYGDFSFSAYSDESYMLVIKAVKQ